MALRIGGLLTVLKLMLYHRSGLFRQPKAPHDAADAKGKITDD